MRFGNSNLRIGPNALFASQLERYDASDVSLESEHLQIEHQLGVVCIGGWDADRAIQIRQVRLGGVALGLLNAPLYLANRIQIFTHDGAVSGPQFSLQARHIFVYRIEH